MAKIHLLDEITANQIAAGEVIERPLSVVKELVENSLDAGAENILIETIQGGTGLIRISDDGCGMSQEDMLMAVQRHATSKLRLITDLNHLQTLGFRGEAIPSILSVARLEIISREREKELGTKLIMENSKLLGAEPVGAPIGTTVTVRELFYNTPARKKFLRSEGYENGLIHEMIVYFSLCYPQVSFQLQQEGKEVLNTKGISNVEDLLGVFYGNNVKESIIMMDEKISTGDIKAYFTLPPYHRANRRAIHIFVNNRRVQSKELTAGLETAYENLLPKGKFPLAVIYLNLDPSLIDVNVHPSKLEVRFRDVRFISEIINYLKEHLDAKKQIPQYIIDLSSWTEKNVPTTQITPQDNTKSMNRESVVQESWRDFYSWDNLNKKRPQDSLVPEKKPSVTDLLMEEPHLQGLSGKQNPSREDKTDNDKNEIVNGSKLPYLTVLGQLDNTFILAEGEDGLYIIDQHVAHERVLYEELKEQKSSGLLESQVLLTPITLNLTVLEETLVLEHILPLTDMGIILEHFGTRTYLLRAVPSCIKEEPLDFFYSLLQELDKKAPYIDSVFVRKQFIITASCKGAIKAGQKMSIEALERLILDLQRTKNSLTCPHGRPIIYKICFEQILKAFKRI